ncbi:hypothetical protein FW778_01950 [Ginsengibacter hankyongi]|uniref:Uncharacterized protein n=1 Tax=Ginsengibacter hankyongi TaxID=2607284 RepID=A0A5J5IL78_9BACT|nr:DUF6266 family protein [Ginsengibacter hankyongi]KAA9040827.1 hypothetical protein FW778_01950 [Ginsengibacter hankyongi]
MTAIAIVIAGSKCELTWSWSDGGSSDTSPTDQVILAAYCPEMRMAIFTTSGGDRSALTASLNAVTFAGKLVETYIGAISADGRNVATSIFTGEVTVS